MARRPALSRRHLLAGLGAGIAGSALGPLSVRALNPAYAQGTPPPRNLIVVCANGGWDTTFVFDPKLDVPEIEGPEANDTEGAEDTATYGDSLLVGVNHVKRPSVRTFFDNWGTRCAVLNGISTGSVAHDPSRMRILTGSGAPGRADISVIAGSIHGASRPLGSLDMSGFSMAGPLGATAGRIGVSSQVKALTNPSAAFTAPSELGRSYPLFDPSTDDRKAIQAVLEARVERMRALRGGVEANDKKLDDLVESALRAERLITDGSATIDQLELGRSPGFLGSLPLAVDFLSRGVCSSVFVDTSARWDTHTGNSAQHGLFQDLFVGLDALATLLDEAGRWDDTVVVVLSEMTRTPKVNTEFGKDHWPYTSALVFGAGVKGGHTFGSTNDLLEAEPMDFATGEAASSGRILEYDGFAASVLELLDVDPGPWFGDLDTFTAWRA